MAEELKKASAVEAPKVNEDAELKALQAESIKLENEIKRAELKAKLTEIKEREANVQDIEERLAERQLRRDNVKQNSVTNGATLKQTNDNEKKTQKRCNHRKGGNGAEAVVIGKGHDSNYALLIHGMSNGDTWIRCLRCGKTWKPVKREWFATDLEFMEADGEYKRALEYNTNNTGSSSYQFRWSDGGEYFRDVTRSTTLR